jgi:hypothetical protein
MLCTSKRPFALSNPTWPTWTTFTGPVIVIGPFLSLSFSFSFLSSFYEIETNMFVCLLIKHVEITWTQILPNFWDLVHWDVEILETSLSNNWCEIKWFVRSNEFFSRFENRKVWAVTTECERRNRVEITSQRFTTLTIEIWKRDKSLGRFAVEEN